MKRRLFSGVALALGASVLLAACGGGGDGEVEPGAGSLSAAYARINHLMTFQQVRDVVGFDYNAGVEDLGTEISYSWQTGKGTTTPELLTVKFENGGATGKIHVTTTRTDSKFW